MLPSDDKQPGKKNKKTEKPEKAEEAKKAAPTSPKTDKDKEKDKDTQNPPRTTTGGWFTAPKFGSAGSGGAELDPGPEND